MDKADYVKSQTQTRSHSCHWTGCEKQVPPAMWGCKMHWFKLPIRLRAKVWMHYKIGQEKTMKPSVKYVEVAKQIQEWIKENQPLRSDRL